MGLTAGSLSQPWSVEDEMNTENKELKMKLEDALKRISDLEKENSRLRELVSNATHPSEVDYFVRTKSLIL